MTSSNHTGQFSYKSLKQKNPSIYDKSLVKSTHFVWDRLERVRKRFDFTEEEWREVLNISKSTYSRLRNGEKEPSLIIVLKVSQMFGISLEALFSDNPYIETKI